jgi:hypothetical protein
MVTVFLTAIAVISIYRGYTAFSQATDAQQQVMEMQQNLRIGMTRLAADIRRAGMNEEYLSQARFITALEECIADDSSVPCLEFGMDISNGGVFRNDNKDNDDVGVKDDGDGAPWDPEALEEDRIGDGLVDDAGEKIKYRLVANGSTNDLVRNVSLAGGGYPPAGQTIITNVEALDFQYFDAGSKGPPVVPAAELTDFGTALEDPPGSVIKNSLVDSELKTIDKVEITLVVRTTNEDYRFTDRAKYKNLRDEDVYDASVQATGPDDPHARRRALTMVVQIRNNL